MAYGPAFMTDLIELKKRGLLDGYRSVVEIGAQQIADRLIKSPVLHEALTLFGGSGLDARPIEQPRITQDSPPGKLLCSALGFDSVSVDIEGADIHLDLNAGQVPPDCRGGFDLAVNTGTTEHVANQGNAFAVIHDLIRSGGLMYHQLPAFGNIDHGFFGYQPKFFHRLAQANDYEIVHLALNVQGEFEPPEYLHAHGLPKRVWRTQLSVAMVQRSSHDFVMPIDA